MVVKRQCSFCAAEIEPGTGGMFVKRDGTVFHFCSSSCRKQQLNLHRVGHRFKWTRAHALKKAADHSHAKARAESAAATPAPGGKPGRRRPKAAPPPPAAETASAIAAPTAPVAAPTAGTSAAAPEPVAAPAATDASAAPAKKPRARKKPPPPPADE